MRWVSHSPPRSIGAALTISPFVVLTRFVFVSLHLPIDVVEQELRRVRFFAVSQVTVRDVSAHLGATETSLRRLLGRNVRLYAARRGKLPHLFVLLLGRGEGS